MIIDRVPGHPDISTIELSGVAFRPSEIPIDFTITSTDGTRETGHVSFRRV